MEFNEHEDFISEITSVPHKKMLIAVSGDGSLSAMNWKRKTRRVTDNLEDELLSVVVMKHNKKVVCGTQSGVLSIYNVGLL